jgi:quercetin dioxygenase-like cupin family protein
MLHREIDGEVPKMTIRAGEAVINAPGVSHRAGVEGTATAVFITAGVGTEHRPR